MGDHRGRGEPIPDMWQHPDMTEIREGTGKILDQELAAAKLRNRINEQDELETKWNDPKYHRPPNSHTEF